MLFLVMRVREIKRVHPQGKQNIKAVNSFIWSNFSNSIRVPSYLSDPG